MAQHTFEVLGDLGIVDCRDNKTCLKGELVVLDDELTNIDALLSGGLIGPTKRRPKKDDGN